jgi:hypothetical protein
MPKNQTVRIGDIDVRIDLESGFFCITDLASLRGDSRDNIRSWMRNSQSINFFEAWEQEHCAENRDINFDKFRIATDRDVSFYISPTQLVEAGCTGIFTKRGRYGGTYCHIDWATHFANWFDARFYVLTIKIARELSDSVYGREAARLRFSRDLTAKNYSLITGGQGLEKIPHVPSLPDPKTKNFKKGNSKEQVRRRLNQFDADIINLALWGMTAMTWRTKFPDQEHHGNMRNLAINEELQVLNTLQAQTRQLQKEQYNQEEKLQILMANAAELLPFYCDTPEKEQALVRRKEERGW